MLIIKPTIKCVYNSQSGISKLTCTHVCTKENLLFTPCNHFPVDATRVPSHKLEFAQHTIIIWKNARVKRTGSEGMRVRLRGETKLLYGWGERSTF